MGLRAEATRRADPSAAHATAAAAPLKAGALQKLGGARTRLSLWGRRLRRFSRPTPLSLSRGSSGFLCVHSSREQ